MRGKKSNPLVAAKRVVVPRPLTNIQYSSLKKITASHLTRGEKVWAAASIPYGRREMLQSLSANGPTAQVPIGVWLAALPTLTNETQWGHWYKCASRSKTSLPAQVWEMSAEVIVSNLIEPAINNPDPTVQKLAEFGDKTLRKLLRDRTEISADHLIEATRTLCRFHKSRFNTQQSMTVEPFAKRWSGLTYNEQLEVVQVIANYAPKSSIRRWSNIAVENLDKLSKADLSVLPADKKV